jgi:hypothetical protein
VQVVSARYQVAEGLRPEPVLAPRQGARPGERPDGPDQGLLVAWEASERWRLRQPVLPHPGARPVNVVLPGPQAGREPHAQREDARELLFSEPSSEPRLKFQAPSPPEAAQASRLPDGGCELGPESRQPPQVLTDVWELAASRWGE